MTAIPQIQFVDQCFNNMTGYTQGVINGYSDANTQIGGLVATLFALAIIEIALRKWKPKKWKEEGKYLRAVRNFITFMLMGLWLF